GERPARPGRHACASIAQEHHSIADRHPTVSVHDRRCGNRARVARGRPRAQRGVRGCRTDPGSHPRVRRTGGRGDLDLNPAAGDGNERTHQASDLDHAPLATRVAWVRDLFERIDVDSRDEKAVAIWRAATDEGVIRSDSVYEWLR